MSERRRRAQDNWDSPKVSLHESEVEERRSIRHMRRQVANIDCTNTLRSHKQNVRIVRIAPYTLSNCNLHRESENGAGLSHARVWSIDQLSLGKVKISCMLRPTWGAITGAIFAMSDREARSRRKRHPSGQQLHTCISDHVNSAGMIFLIMHTSASLLSLHQWRQ